MNNVPKYSRGNLVKYTKQRSDEIIKSRKLLLQEFTSKELGESPLGRLIIYSDPFWSNQHKNWMYPYEYGIFGDHEGYALETELEIYT